MRILLQMSLLNVLLFVAKLSAADPPPDVVDFFRVVTQALADAHSDDGLLSNDAATFLGNFDPKMEGYAELRAGVEDMVARARVGAALEFVADDGDDNKRTLDVDWTLEIEGQRPRRATLKCIIERSGSKKKWKITSLAPVSFFKY
jgi:hypothetical protein